MAETLLRDAIAPTPPRTDARASRVEAAERAGVLVLAGDGDPPCAIADFTGRLTAALAGDGAHTLRLGRRTGSPAAIWRAVGASRAVLVSVPVVAWKRVLARPLLAMVVARLRGRGAVLVLHEWAALHPLRRAALLPALHLASRVVMLSPRVRAEVAADPLARPALARGALAPMPPNVGAPARAVATPLSARLAAARREGRLVLGHFGSIYAGKNPEAMLAIAAALKARGARPLLVYVGSFVRGLDRVEDEFRAAVAAYGLADDVLVSGYVAGEPELYGLFAEMSAFAYVFPEGLTARRSSVLACVQSGRPVVVTEPARADEFDHHPRQAALVRGGALELMPAAAGPDDYASRILAVAERPDAPAAIDLDAWWADTAAAIRPYL